MAKLNILPVPTFAHLGVNFTERGAAFSGTENITVPENTEQQIIQFRDSDGESTVNIGKNAKLKLVQIFTGGCVSKLTSSLEDNAELDIIQLYHRGDTVSEIIAELNGHKSVFTADIGYDLSTGDELDINLVSLHRGRRTVSDINVSGVLRDNAKKTFKGTIDFRNKAAGSKGSEKEDVLLMNRNVVNRTVPVILCSEEDVEGSHGATVGRIDEQHIFYMKSRGIPEEKIYEMMTGCRLMRIIEKIGDGQAAERICKMLGWGDDID